MPKRKQTRKKQTGGAMRQPFMVPAQMQLFPKPMPSRNAAYKTQPVITGEGFLDTIIDKIANADPNQIKQTAQMISAMKNAQKVKPAGIFGWGMKQQTGGAVTGPTSKMSII